MPTQTDRDKIKKMQEGHALTADGMVDAKTTTAEIHSRPFTFLKTGTENAATNVAESPICLVPVKSRARKFGIQVAANVATDNTNYVVIGFYKRASGTSTLVASWNTHGGAQGALTTAGPGVISSSATGLVTNSDADIAANSGLYYTISKFGSGQAVNTLSVFTAWLEEI